MTPASSSHRTLAGAATTNCAGRSTTHTQEIAMHRVDADARASAAAIDALGRRFPSDEVIRDRARALRAEIQFVAREAWRAVE